MDSAEDRPEGRGIVSAVAMTAWDIVGANGRASAGCARYICGFSGRNLG